MKMKKISWIFFLSGILMLTSFVTGMISATEPLREHTVGIIGGADSPTFEFIMTSSGLYLPLVAGVVFLLSGIITGIAYKLRQHRTKHT